MRYKLQSLSGLMAFDAAARLGSLTLAAKELGRTQSAVSQQVKTLEEQLGVALFARRPRAIELTTAGRTLALAVSQALENIDRSVADISRKREVNVIRLTAYHSFALLWLIPRLAKFSLKYPEIDVRLNADDRIIDLVAEGYDLAVRGGRIGRLPDGVTSIRDEVYMPVYAPQLAPGRDLTIADLGDYPLLGYSDGSYWRHWFELNGMADRGFEVSRRYSHSGLLVQAAMVGGGVGIAPLTNAADALFDGRLKCIRGEPFRSGQCFYLVPAERPMPKQVELFTRWIRDEMVEMEGELEEMISNGGQTFRAL
ncbi:LysR substrate-binding domain-containing protein [Kordiimonas aestuarii]|uniref:LysR substrate-binding domain-containing protein n=1 Tax=Kordiimonas aestuarii TaxID=1005925 RepID=UPI0021CF5BDB|nr:LysR substrate-binding domain-containing protein [Kordiimonas aestuarii]